MLESWFEVESAQSEEVLYRVNELEGVGHQAILRKGATSTLLLKCQQHKLKSASKQWYRQYPKLSIFTLNVGQ